jgi:hypothetical protein
VFDTLTSCSFDSSFDFFSILSFIYSLSSFLFFSILSLFAIFDKSDGGFKPVYFYTFCYAVGVYDEVPLLATSTSFSAFTFGFFNT